MIQSLQAKNLTKDEVEQIRDEWYARHVGPQNALEIPLGGCTRIQAGEPEPLYGLLDKLFSGMVFIERFWACIAFGLYVVGLVAFGILYYSLCDLTHEALQIHQHPE